METIILTQFPESNLYIYIYIKESITIFLIKSFPCVYYSVYESGNECKLNTCKCECIVLETFLLNHSYYCMFMDCTNNP